jgi:2-polyprenyl-6-methoxyphenol hydroxylase-like FAD-dependent oxidoreductase
MGNRPRILISGAGIAGLTLAYWLKRYGFEPTIVEKAPTLRAGGYMIDFWGLGFDVAEKMGLLQKLGEAHYDIPELDYVDQHGKRKGGLSIIKMREAVNFRHYNLLRSDLERVLYDIVAPDVDIRFGKSVEAIEQDTREVRVILTDGSSEPYDLLVGADGLHSNVREKLYGDESEFERYLGYYTSSFTIDNYLGDDRMFKSYSTPGKQIGLYSIAEGRMATFFIFKEEERLDISYHDTKAQKELLTKVFKDEGWESRRILNQMESAPDFYFDSVSQIYLQPWSRGRTTLVGDAAHCVSLLAGQGSALAMASAYVLAGELREAEGNHEIAYRRYEELMMPEVLRTQRLAQEFADEFVPPTGFAIWKRNHLSRLMPLMMRSFVKRFMETAVTLKDYEAPVP